jgi:hypothetical protein
MSLWGNLNCTQPVPTGPSTISHEGGCLSDPHSLMEPILCVVTSEGHNSAMRRHRAAAVRTHGVVSSECVQILVARTISTLIIKLTTLKTQCKHQCKGSQSASAHLLSSGHSAVPVGPPGISGSAPGDHRAMHVPSSYIRVAMRGHTLSSDVWHASHFCAAGTSGLLPHALLVVWVKLVCCLNRTTQAHPGAMVCPLPRGWMGCC